MSITAHIQQIHLPILEAINKDPQQIKTVISYYEELDFEDDLPLSETFTELSVPEETPVLGLDKSWHLISYILTNSTEMENLPFLVNEVSAEDNLPSINAILCGAPIGKESEYSSYGYLRYLLPEEVRAISAALSKFSNADIRARFDRAILTQPDIYAVDWEDAEAEFEFMLKYLEKL